MIPSSKPCAFLIGLLVAVGLVSAALSRYQLPMFQWFLISHRDVMLVWFVALAITALALLMWHVSPGISWLLMAYLLSAWSYGFRGDTLTNVWFLVAACIILLLLTEAWGSHKRIILFGLLVGVCVNVAVALMQAFVTDLGIPAPAGLVFRDPFFAIARHIREIEGLATHYSLLIAVLTITLPLLISAFRLGWLLILPTAYFIYFAGHRSGALALLFLLILIPKRIAFLPLKRLRWVALVGVLIFVASVFYLRGSFSSGYAAFSPVAWTGDRITVWITTAAKATQKPWLGWGPGSFAAWHPTFVRAETGAGLTWLQAHNEFLQTYFDVGLIGLLAVPIWLVDLIRKLRRARPWTSMLRAAVASVAIATLMAFCSFPLRIAVTTLTILVALAALHGELNASQPCN